MFRPRMFKLHVSLGNRLFVTTLVVIALCACMSEAVDEGYIVESVILTVYRDGVIHIEGAFAVDETYPNITVPLLSSSVNNIVVLDENRTVLDYEVTGAEMTIYTLGATAVLIEYDTAALTVKEADVWTLSLDNPYNLTVILPEGSTIIYLNRLPDSIDAQNQRIFLSLPPGDWEISYVLPIVPSSVFQVSNLTVNPQEVEASGEVTISAKVTNVGEGGGSYLVMLKINGNIEANKTVILQPGESTTVEFKVRREEPGVYTAEIAGLTAQFKVKEAPIFPLTYAVLIALIAVGATFMSVLYRRKRGPNVEKIFRTYPYLRQEDKDVINFLVERGGKAFESEIRERFPEMPRTSLWRLVRRLEKMEIVKVRRVGLQNQVELKNIKG